MAGFRIFYVLCLSFHPTPANPKISLFKKKSLVSYLHKWIIQNNSNIWILNHTLIFRVSNAVKEKGSNIRFNVTISVWKIIL